MNIEEIREKVAAALPEFITLTDCKLEKPIEPDVTPASHVQHVGIYVTYRSQIFDEDLNGHTQLKLSACERDPKALTQMLRVIIFPAIDYTLHSRIAKDLGVDFMIFDEELDRFSNSRVE